ncbi:MAG: extracellular solute-binding protein [bacterium]
MKRAVKAVATILALAGMVLLLSISGCRGGRDSVSTVKLTYWSSTNPEEIKLSERLTQEWNQAHPDTQVILQPLPEGRSGEEVLIVASAGGTTPDICSNVSPTITPLLAKANALLPLDIFEDGRSFIRERLPEGMEKTFVNSDGKLYQIPWKGNPIMVQYNVGMLRDVGVTKLPRTWSEWNAAAARVTRDTNGDGRPDNWMADIQVESEWRRRLFDFYTFYIAATNGCTLLKDGQVDFDNPIALAVFSFFAEGFNRGWYPRTILSGDQFLQQHFAAHVSGPWNIAHTERFKPEGFEYAFGPIPVPDTMRQSLYTFGDPKSIGIFSTCEHPEAAWEFVKHLISRRSDLLLLEVANQLPLRRDLLTDSLYKDYFQRNPMMLPFAEKVPTTIGFDQNTALQEVFDAVDGAFDEGAIHNAVDPADAIRHAAERSRHILRMRGG